MFKVNRLTGYSIMIISTMIKESDLNNARLFTASSLSKQTNLPLATVTKVLKQLAICKLVTSQRGIKGGYSISPHSHQASFADVIEYLEGPIRISDCDSGKPCYIKEKCPIYSVCDEVNDKIKTVLQDVKLTDIALRLS